MTRSYAPAEITHLQAREGVRARLLVWIQAKNRATGAIEPAGFWSGEQDQSFTINAVSRSYFGAGALLGMDDITHEVGLQVRRIGVWFNSAAPELIDAVMGYDVRLAKIEIHRVLTDPLSHQAIATPHRIWKGWVDGAPRVVPAKGLAPGRVTVQVASAALALTKGSPAKLSDEQWQQTTGGDRIFRYADVSGKVPIYWGSDKIRADRSRSDTPGVTDRRRR